MRLEVTQEGEGIDFKAVNEDGSTTKLTASEKAGGTIDALRPMQLVLAGLAGCGSIDTLLILKKQKQTVTNYKVTVDAERDQEVPKAFTSIHLTFDFEGEIEAAKAERAVDLALNKYCSVRHSLDPKINIAYTIKINGHEL